MITKEKKTEKKDTVVSIHKKAKKAETSVASVEPQHVEFRSREERIAAGKLLREKVTRASHAGWTAPANRQDPIDVLEASNQDRVPELVPIRYGRMLRSPFTFLRGSAGLMAYDLSTTPTTGLRVQACGDCHLLNFGAFATPERNLIFDINDFDETLPAPWEWDIKRLAASFAVAVRDGQFSDEDAQAVAVECVRAYREKLREYSKMNPLEIWYDRLDADTLIAMAPDEKIRRFRERLVEKAQQRIGDYLLPKIASVVGGRHRLLDQPPIMFHVQGEEYAQRAQDVLEAYRQSLSDERRVLFDRYRLEDFAAKVVGIGSVGTRCFVGLFFSAENHPLLLQFKEACPSVLEPYAGESRYDNHAQRVVMGQRLIQSSSDIFLGWARVSDTGRDFFVRQLRDMKMSAPIEGGTVQQFHLYAEICGWTLARAHARSGDAATISGYLGKSDSFDQAIGSFAMAYADQTERDHAALVQAVNSRRVKAIIEENE
ncbi:DUF2252 domain-containing protein [Methylomicrobium sp. Wu6]|uniref:DUF2252 domain-containing protein n=1 Tax=Methylomicrobium sp. Wu6 TaxID=3107928 RepID=UPI002DD6B5C7|nr:DUF2252 domain-containing protein [Methylomicrobium sp. Wu6]MEC4747924.1 DUF2252 domain-containing protein [Methylomicrobium sp. Wu6]